VKNRFSKDERDRKNKQKCLEKKKYLLDYRGKLTSGLDNGKKYTTG